MIRINIFGDFCVEYLNGLSFSKELDDLLSQADVNALNFEAPIKIADGEKIPKSGPHLCQDPEAPYFLQEKKFNLIMLANNHIMDYGETSATKTIEAFSNSTVIGVGEFSRAYNASIIEKGGKKIAFLSITQFEFGVLDDKEFCNNRMGTAWMLHPSIDSLIIAAKHECDYLIVLPHAGLEHFEYPLPELRTLYKHFVDMGADAVIGGHPHIPQGWEIYKDSPIVYSLGNFCFDSISNNSNFWNIGIAATLELSDFVSLKIIPIKYEKNKRCVKIDKREETQDFLQHICDVLNDNCNYLDIVNRKCLAMELLYIDMIESSGFYRTSIKRNIIQAFRRILNKLSNRLKVQDMTHLVNCMRCESHRWVISRIFELKYNKWYV